MLCCALLLALAGIILRRGQAEDPFPPQARRVVGERPGDWIAPGAAFDLADPARSGSPRRPPRLAWMLIVAGGGWTLLSEIAMHGFGLFTFVHDSLALDVVFHFSGFWALVFGVYLLQRPAAQATPRGTSSRTSRETAAV